MKQFYKQSFVMGFICAVLALSGATVFGEAVQKTISATFGKVSLIVNGAPVKKETLLYDGATYLPLRATAEILGMDVAWDEATFTAILTNKSNENKADEGIVSQSVKFYPNHGLVPDFGALYSISPVREDNEASSKTSAYIYKNSLPENEDFFAAYENVLSKLNFTKTSSSPDGETYFMKENVIVNIFEDGSYIGVIVQYINT